MSADLIFIVFDRSSLPFLSKTKDILFSAADEYGFLAFSYLRDISVIGYRHSLSIDDLVSEECFKLKAEEYCPWIPSKPETEERIFIKKLRYKWMRQRNPAAAEQVFGKELIEKYFPEDRG